MKTQSSPDIEALVGAFYAAFDNRDGRTPDGDGLLAMFAPEAVITRVAEDQPETWRPAAFVAPRMHILTDGTLTDFHEWEVEERTVVLNNIANRWSTYEKAGKLNSEDYRGGGDKFITLRREGGRWLITSILWQDR